MRTVTAILLTAFVISPAHAGECEVRTTVSIKAFSAGTERVEAKTDVFVKYGLGESTGVVLQPRLWLAGWGSTINNPLTDGGRRTPSLVEGYVWWQQNDWRLRLGQQRIGWGRIDKVSPLDLWGSQNIRDLLDSEQTGASTLRLDRFFGENGSVELYYSPRQSRSDLPLPGESWWLGPAVPLSEDKPRGPAIAIRVSRSFGPVDTSAFVLRHTDPIPYYMPEQNGISQHYVRELVYGGNFVLPIANWVTTAEAAYHRPGYLKDDYVALAVQAERIWSLPGDRSLTLDLGYLDRLTVERRDQFPVSLDWPFRQAPYLNLSLTRNGVAGAETWQITALRQAGGDFYVNPEWSKHLNQHQKLTVGFDLLGGNAETFFGAFRGNRRGYVEFKSEF